MSADTIGALIVWLIVLVAAVAVAVALLRWLYRRSTVETAFVRTGFLGRKVVVDGGAFVVPVLHEITPVAMNVQRIAVARQGPGSLITRDRMRVDMAAEFFVRVGPTAAMVAAAAQTLGGRTLREDGLRDLLEGKFASAMRSAAARGTLEELHERRAELAAEIRALASEGLAANGLELESAALVELDQTPLEHFDPSNAFDAEGMTRLTETIEARRRMRNEIEQRSVAEIRAQNLATQRRVLEIDRDAQYAELEQEREVETRRAGQRADLARERAERAREAEEAEIAAAQAVELARLAQDRALTEDRTRTEEGKQRREVARRRALDEAELAAREATEREAIALEAALEAARIEAERDRRMRDLARQRALEIEEVDRQVALAAKAAEAAVAEAERDRARLRAEQGTEAERLAQQRALDEARVERERRLEQLQIAKRQAFEEAEIASAEEVERARITADRALAEARVLASREVRAREIERDAAIEAAEIDRDVATARKSQERHAAVAAAESVRAKALEAEEAALTARERAVAERRKATDLIAAARDAEAQALRLTAAAEAEARVSRTQADAARILAEARAEAEKVAALAAAARYAVDAEGARQLNEAENALSEPARAGRLRAALLERIEGIVRESVRPMEKIEGIKILHLDTGGGGGGGGKNVTDEVIDSALRYRVQAPMIDSLMREIGLEGGSMGRMTDVLRDAKDMGALVSRAEAKGRPNGHATGEAPATGAKAAPGGRAGPRPRAPATPRTTTTATATGAERDAAGLRLGRAARARRPGLGGGARLRRVAALDRLRRREPDRERLAGRPRRLRGATSASGMAGASASGSWRCRTGT